MYDLSIKVTCRCARGTPQMEISYLHMTYADAGEAESNSNASSDVGTVSANVSVRSSASRRDCGAKMYPSVFRFG
jgi:hypothetical protein